MFFSDKSNLETFQRLIQYSSIIHLDKSITPLDDMNYNINIFDEVISIEDVIRLQNISPGYSSPDGSIELGQLIKDLEKKRLIYLGLNNSEACGRIDNLGVGCGNGCANVAYAVLNSVLKVYKNKVSGTPEIVLFVPSYTVYFGQLSQLKNIITPKYVYTKRVNDYLPTVSELKEHITDNTVAIILTYPGNPAQSTYENERNMELLNIVRLCQAKGIFLIADNIYQDLLYPKNRKFTELFSLSNSHDYLIKIYGSSKDTPFFSGYRTGYWIGDPIISDAYKYFMSSSENSMNFYSMIFFGMNIFFKSKLLASINITYEDTELFSKGIFCKAKYFDRHKFHYSLVHEDLLAKYSAKINKSYNIQKNAIGEIKKYLENSDVFCDFLNQDIGHAIFIRVNPNYFRGTDDDFFWYLIEKLNYGILPGNVFGFETKGEIWFRITVINDHTENILNKLHAIEKLLVSGRNY